MTKRRQRVLISDLGNVLLFFDRSRTYRAIAQLASADESDVRRAVESSGIRERYEQNSRAFASAQAFLAALRSVLHGAGLRGVFADDTLADAWCALFWENERVHDIVRRLKHEEGLPLILLSDTNELHYDYFRTRYRDIHALFDVEILSFQAGISKERDAEKILHLAIRASARLVPDVQARDVLYIDDREEFIDAAKTLGIDAHLYRTDRELVTWLSDRGYRLPIPGG